MIIILFLQKVEIVRKSYRAQLSNAIQKIAGEYKVYLYVSNTLHDIADVHVHVHYTLYIASVPNNPFHTFMLCSTLTHSVQTYYNELLQGKTGRHDLKIKELKHT